MSNEIKGVAPSTALPEGSEPVVLAARQLDSLGRCCGRKPIHYQRAQPYFFCLYCAAEFRPDGQQQPNWEWLAHPGGFVARYPDQQTARAVIQAQARDGATPQSAKGTE